jgi:CRISPR-associated protein Csd2
MINYWELQMAIQHRYDFVLLFDVKDGNPNGDPDAGNLPRLDAETGRGLVTDVCLKRKIRNYVGLIKSEQPPFEIYVKEKAVLNKTHERAYQAIGSANLLSTEDKKRKGGDKVEEARQWMCANFYDVRTFGAVMSTGVNCGQVRGPVQLTFSRSVEPIVSSEHSITRMAVTTEKEAENQGGDNRTMGRKFTVPYGLYVAHGFISASLANQTGFSDDDLNLLWDALSDMFEHDRSAARGEMTTRGLYVFKHESPLGNAKSNQLFDRIKIDRITEGPARNFSDYKISVNQENLPDGVELLCKVG